MRSFWCIVFTRWFNSEFWWFLLSDVSMYYLYKYYMASHVPKISFSVDSDREDESDEEEESDEEVQRLIKPRTAVSQPAVQQQQIVYVPMSYYYTTTPTTTYHTPQVAPVYYY